MTPNRKIVVAHIVLGLEVGGLERVVVNLVRGFQESNYQSTVIALHSGGAFVSEIEQLGVPITVLAAPPGRSLTVVRQLARLLRAQRVQIVHFHNPAPHFYAILAALLARVPVRVHTKHGRNYPEDRNRVRLTPRLAPFLAPSAKAISYQLHVVRIVRYFLTCVESQQICCFHEKS